MSVCALASGFSSEVHGLCTVTTCSTSNQSSNNKNINKGQISGNDNINNSNSNSNSNSNKNNNNNNDNSSIKGFQERESKVSKNVKFKSATQKQIIHYKALDSGVKGCLSNNV